MVQIGLLLSLLWKGHFFWDSIKVYASTPLFDDFFPAFLRSYEVLVGTFMSTITAIAFSIVTGNRRLRMLAGMVALIGLSILCVHQGSYNDMTFVTAWWTSLWSLWYATRMGRDAPDVLLRKASLLSRCILSMILLGGAAGKWTSEYWSGDVLYDIYFVDRDFWTFNTLRSHYDTDTLRQIATRYSQLIVVTETTFGLTLWLLPAKWAAIAGMALLTSIAVFSNFLLFSVLLSLIGLAAVGLFVSSRSQQGILITGEHS